MAKTFTLPSGRKLTVSVESAPKGQPSDDAGSTEPVEPETEEK